ncbi:MAG: orotidine-5'-phosphate decarboxylase [Acidobacteriia bacterium]|nr:orotidine-5'-phosphate decarboxylase [Terriglobia bacterium]
MSDIRERLIVALDVPNAPEARNIVAMVGDSAQIFKVGKQLFTAEGPQVVRDLVAFGRDVFLDLKFHDIPNTVAAAVRQAAQLRVRMLTVHASGGLRMLKAAVEAARSGVATDSSAPTDSPSNSAVARFRAIPRPLILAVTVLTSLNDEDLVEIGVSGRVLDQALRLADLARRAGCDGVVTSAREVRELRRELGPGFIIVTPGIRPAGTAQRKDDQERAATPAEAIAAGATHIVVGRPITAASDPAAAARRILAEISSACPVTV